MADFFLATTSNLIEIWAHILILWKLVCIFLTILQRRNTHFLQNKPMMRLNELINKNVAWKHIAT